MQSKADLDRLLVTMDVAVQSFAICEVARGRRLVGAKVDAIMVHYVLAGTMHMTIPGIAPVVCGPGSIVLVPPGMQPSMAADDGPAIDVLGDEIASVSRDGLLVMDAADGQTGDLRLAAGIVLASLSGSFGLLDRLKAPIWEDMSGSEIVRHAYGTMLTEIGNPGLGARALTGALMKTCLVVVIRRFFERAGEHAPLLGGLSDPRLASAAAAILDQPAAPHTVASLAAEAGMSRSAFASHFTNVLGLAPMEFVAKTRLRHAADMLRSTNLPIKVIAASIGFSSRSHFSRAFRSAYGKDPTQFRKHMLAVAIDAPDHLTGSRSRYGLAEEPSD